MVNSRRCRERFTFVLIHGAWHAGSVFGPVAAHLRSAGHDVHAPTLAGHGPDADPDVSLDEAVDSLVDYVESRKLCDVVLVGWSLGGVFVSAAASRIRDRIARVMFHSALVLRDGETAYDALPPKAAEAFRGLARGGVIELPRAMHRDVFVPGADRVAAERLYREHVHPQPERLVDTPAAGMNEFVELVAGGLPTSYILSPDDIVMPPGKWGWQRFLNRLGSPRTIHLTGGHAPMLTAPAETATAYVLAGRA
ncbi:MAG: alpha/beta fold hydrolase [Stackebrandtia sp.]